MTAPNTMPSGGPIPSIEEDTVDGAQQAQAEEERLLAGKYKTPEELEKGYENLASMSGKTQSELANLKQLAEAQSQQLAMLQQQQAQQQQQAVAENPLQAQYQKIMGDLEEGDISYEQALQMSNELTAKMATQAAVAQSTEAFQQELAKREQQQIQQQFLDQNPDFLELQQSGKLAAIRQKNPLHDDFSAYQEFKRQEESAAAYERGKQEQAKLMDAEKQTHMVMNRPGANVRHTNKTTKPMSESDKKASMLAALKAAQAAQAGAG